MIFRQRLRMALFAQQALVCTVSLVLALSCSRVDNSRVDNAQRLNGSPEAPFLAAEPVVLSPEEQTDDALAATRRSDANANGQLPQLTPQEHMKRAAIYQANRAF